MKVESLLVDMPVELSQLELPWPDELFSTEHV